MNDDPFGDLREWGRVLTLLDELSNQKALDQVQAGLVRLIRFPNNWQIREGALVSAREVVQPTTQLLSAVSDLVVDRSVYLDARILAVNVLAVLLARKSLSASHHRAQALDLLRQQLLVPEAPVFQLAVERAIEKISRTGADRMEKNAAEAFASAE